MKRYKVWRYINDSSGIEGWDMEIVTATDKEAAFRQVYRWSDRYDENKVELAENSSCRIKEITYIGG
jgi:SH3-like domain-containing protein